ncbi:MAG: GtrA family protein [Endomicrobium sp.]|jgi:putative flippase GtrA|nr:GtrA family protein [Endomicrobium sp.]
MHIIKKQFIKFLFIGALNTLFAYCVYALFLSAGFHYALSALCSTFLGILFNFKTIGVIVFKNRDNTLIFSFFAVYIAIYLLNIAGLKLLKTFFSDDMYVNALILAIPFALISFIVNKNFVFKNNAEAK